MKKTFALLLSVGCLMAAFSLRADVREGLVSYWPMDTATGANPMVTPDVVGGNDLIGPGMDSSTAIVAGHFGNCVSFSGNYLYVTNADGADSGLPVAKGGSWSCSLWVNGPSGQASQTTYFGQTSSYSDNWRFSMESDGTTKTRYVIRDGHNNVLRQVTRRLHQYAWTARGISSPTPTMPTMASSLLTWMARPNYTTISIMSNTMLQFNQVGIGALVRTSVGNNFSGSVDDVALWARALSQSEDAGCDEQQHSHAGADKF